MIEIGDTAPRGEQGRLRRRCAHPAGGHSPFPWDDVNGSVHGRFERIARAFPHHPAIESEALTLTYDELNRRANRVARAIRLRLRERPQPVGLLLDHGVEPIVALLSILKAGHIYMPLSPSDPELRIRQIMEQSGCRLLLASESTLGAAERAGRGLASILKVDDLPGGLSDSEPGVDVQCDDGASLYYTSGSTGRPKGVLYSHQARLVNALRNTNALRLSPHDRLTLLYPSRYAGAANTTFGALLNGACLLPFDFNRHGAGKLAGWLDERRITIYHSVPAIYRRLVALAEPGRRLDHLRLVMLASDSVYPSDLAAYRRLCPRSCLFVNTWGVSESPLFRPCFFDHDSPAPEAGLPAVGSPPDDPLDEDEVLLLDDFGGEVEDGATGEIVVRSRYLATGYWRDEEQTEQRFRRDPASSKHQRYHTGDLGRRSSEGTVVHLGRKDFQVQIGGERVEVAEIESALTARPNIRAAAVVAKSREGGEQRLIAYIECTGPAPAEDELRAYLEARLPRQMTPNRFVICEALPLTQAGKVDRRRLPEPARARPKLSTVFKTPRTSIEVAVAAAFGKVLEIDEVGLDDSFFGLGGKSLSAMRVMAEIVERYGVRLEAAEFFESSTVESLSGIVAARLLNRADPSSLAELLDAVEGTPDAEARRLLED